MTFIDFFESLMWVKSKPWLMVCEFQAFITLLLSFEKCPVPWTVAAGGCGLDPTLFTFQQFYFTLILFYYLKKSKNKNKKQIQIHSLVYNFLATTSKKNETFQVGIFNTLFTNRLATCISQPLPSQKIKISQIYSKR